MLLIIFSFEQRYQVVKGKSKILAAVFNIDIETKKEIFSLLEQSASRGNFHLIFFYAGRVVILERG